MLIELHQHDTFDAARTLLIRVEHIHALRDEGADGTTVITAAGEFAVIEPFAHVIEQYLALVDPDFLDALHDEDDDEEDAEALL